MIIINKAFFLLCLSSSLFLYGCSSSDEPSPVDSTLSGTFNTPTVNGLKYTTATQSGTTDSNGTFKYNKDEVIRFYIGDIYLGEAYAKNSLTPLDLTQTVSSTKSSTTTRASNIDASWTVNLFNLLKNLDANNDLSDGIEITRDVSNAAVSLSLQLELAPTDFNAHSSTTSFITSVNITLDDPTTVSVFIRSNYQDNSDWGTLVWGTSNWSN